MRGAVWRALYADDAGVSQRIGEDDDGGRGGVRGVRPDGVVEEDRGPRDEITDQTGEGGKPAAAPPPHHSWLSRQRDNGTPRRPSSDIWAGSSMKTASLHGRSTTGAGQRRGARDDMARSCSIGREHRRDSRSIYYKRGRWGLCVRLRGVVPTARPRRALTTIHLRWLLRVIGYRRRRGTYRELSYAQALKIVGCQCVEAMVRQRRLHFAGGWSDSRKTDFRSE